MSLSKIGKVGNAVKLLNTAATSRDIATGISSLSNSLRAAGNMSAGVNWISKYGKGLDSGIAYQALKQAFPKESLTEDMLAKIGYTANGAGKVGNAPKFSSVGSTFAGLGTFFKSIWPVLAVVSGITIGTAAGKMLWDNVLTDNAAQKNLQESVQKYKTEKSDLDNLQSQKETNKQRVYELRAKSNRTAAEDNELNNLLNEDSILDAQIGLKKRTVTSAQKQQALDAKKALEKRTFQGELFGKSPYPVYQDTNIGYAQKLMSGLEDEKQARKDVLNNKEWSSERKEAELKVLLISH